MIAKIRISSILLLLRIKMNEKKRIVVSRFRVIESTRTYRAKMYLIIINLSVLIYLFNFTQALECGISVGSSNNEIKKLADSCMNVINKDVDEKNSTNTTLNNTNYEYNNSTGEQEVSHERKRDRRNASNNNTTDADRLKTEQEPVKDEGKSQNCVVQCIFEKLAMTDNNGYPEYAKVSEGLLKKAGGRELKDFLQDSADVCFQQLKDSKLEPCQYSIQLVGCLAEKGKLNCADWPIGELPFKMKNDTNQMSHKSTS